MSTDQSVTKDLLQTLEDGKDGYEKAAEKLGGLDESSLVATFQGFAQQRMQFADELQGLAAAYGDDPDRSGSMAAAIHRGWMSLKDALSKDSAASLLEVAEQGENHAVSEYEKALDSDVSPELHMVIERQLGEIRQASATISGLVSAQNN